MNVSQIYDGDSDPVEMKIEPEGAARGGLAGACKNNKEAANCGGLDGNGRLCSGKRKLALRR
jgi:hypothetical protein